MRGSIESLEHLLSRRRVKHIYATCKESPSYELFSRSLPPECVVEYSPPPNFASFEDDLDIYSRTDAWDLLHAIGVNELFLISAPTKEFEKWARPKKARLVSPPSDYGSRFEDKIKFHDLMLASGVPVPDGVTIKKRMEIPAHFPYPGVLQVPRSHGSLGTFKVNSYEETLRTISKRKLSFPLVLRRFIDGPAFGITLLIGPRKTIFSAIRLQCSLPGKGDKLLYCGVQWVPSHALSRREIASIEFVFSRVAAALRKAGFCGMANLDFVLSELGPVVIECNPRISGASPHLGMEPSLLHGLSYCDEYSRVASGKDPTRNLPHLPKSNFEGTLLDFDFLLGKLSKDSTKSSRVKTGFYAPKGGAAEFKTYSLKEASKLTRWILVQPFQNAGDPFGPNPSLGIAVTSFPIFSFSKNKATLPIKSDKIIRSLSPLFL